MRSLEIQSKKELQFIEDLKKTLHTVMSWERTECGHNEISLKEGINLDCCFPDTEGLLETAYDDFRKFLKAGNIHTNGKYRIVTEEKSTDTFEAFRIEITAECCRILAGDTEGIRRGLVFLEDEIMRTKGPFLPKKTFERKPLIKTRISRCFFGPTVHGDELADDVDYYPKEYLNRLVHEGINALWLTVQFKDLCPSELFPEQGQGADKRLAKLCKTVELCRRYGIKIYILCNEPVGFGNKPEYLYSEKHLKKHPELGGYRFGGRTFFCTSSEKGRKYVEDCTYHIFSKVPSLGGLLNISIGERSTNCYSAFWEKSIWDNNCPRCSKRKPWEVLSELHAAFAKGMHRADSEAEFIAWAYVPYIDDSDYSIEDKKEILRQIAANTPEDVTFQLNFESNGTVEQLGKKHTALDYWLAWPGPSDLFEDSARNAVKTGARASAKIQTGCSHEVATIPFLPVPGNLYKKYQAMHKLGVSTVMQCWYFGNYPGIMNKAAGELSFAPVPDKEDDFLFKLAEPIWGRNAQKVVKAWKYFQDGYSNFPISLSFAWFGPIHNSVVWPLYVKPADRPISPSWEFSFPLQSGDRIGECIGYSHTLNEVLILLERMLTIWNKGVEILEGLASEYLSNKERMLDIGLAKALGIQFESAYHMFCFYDLRERMPFMEKAEQIATLKKMKQIVSKEIKNCAELKELCFKDSRLGYHSEAEGYKYCPDELDWRVGMLENLLAEDFKELQPLVEKSEVLFPEYTGISPQGRKYICHSSKDDALWKKFDEGANQWKSWHDKKTLYFELKIPSAQWKNKTLVQDTWRQELWAVEILIEPKRLWPAWHFYLYPNGETYLYDYKVNHDGRWEAKAVGVDKESVLVLFSIPFDYFEEYRNRSGAMRVNISCGKSSWIKKNPFKTRLLFNSDNPADLGWLIFK